MNHQRSFLQKNINQINSQHVETHTRMAMPIVLLIVLFLLTLAAMGAEASNATGEAVPVQAVAGPTQ